MQALLGTLPFAQAYIDDIVIFSTSLTDHYNHVKQVITILNLNNLKLNIDKCHFGFEKLHLLGFIVSSTGHTIDPEKITNAQTWPIPTTIKQLQSLLGSANYLREHIPMYSNLTAPLDSLRNSTDIKSDWSSTHDTALSNLKLAIQHALCLSHFNPKIPLLIATDASLVGIGAVLYQEIINPNNTTTNKYLSFQAHSLSVSERNYSATK
jgi:hypothetical protein